MLFVGRPAVERWKAFTRVFLIGDFANWSIADDIRELKRICRALKIPTPHPRWIPVSDQQVLYYGSHYTCFNVLSKETTDRLATSYFHGIPGRGNVEFDESYRTLCRHHERLSKVRVTNRAMMELVLESGIDPEKVSLIPIGVNLKHYSVQTPESRRAARARWRIPQDAAVVGSFQKDGVGWGYGLTPKLVKGPDVFLDAIEMLHTRVPELFVVLSGPARGYVTSGLERLGVPYKHFLLPDVESVGRLYQTLDAYLISSRDEGGPKGVLESMASGIPLVTTIVGQARDLVRHGENGWLVELEDPTGLAQWTEYVLMNRRHLDGCVTNARTTAEEHAYERQTLEWERFFEGLVLK